MDIQLPILFNTSRAVRLFLFLAAAIVIVGCGPKPAAVGTLSGRVTNQGQAVTNAQIFFENAAAGSGTVADLDAEGRFTVATADGPGLPPGKYQVAIKPRGTATAPSANGDLPLEALAGSSAAKDKPPTNDLIPESFHSFRESGLAVEIKLGQNPDWEIDLAKAQPVAEK